MSQAIRITSPSNGAKVGGKVTIVATVTSVKIVNFYVDGIRVATDSASPFSDLWDTTQVANGSHVLKAVSGNGKVSSTITVTVANPTISASVAGGEATFDIKAG